MSRRWVVLIACVAAVTGVLGTRGLAMGVAGPVVKISAGTLAGTRFGSSGTGAAFLGVPYAAAPVGELRWRPPEPAAKWSGVREAKEFGSPCAQLPATWFKYIEGHEDCLYLNVWTPKLSEQANLPVLVYFHGGSNTQGYSQMTPLGPSLSQYGLVVVSANYRLGPFGFLAHPALTKESEHHASGNYGLLDQMQVLKWVKENIVHFGGDPARVTVMGQSAGAVDACLLMASPLAQMLFQRAILESGECQGTLNEDIRKPISYNQISGTGEGNGKRLVRDLELQASPELPAKMRAVSADQILKAWKEDRGLHFDAIVDGWVIPEQPAKIFAAGKEMHIPVMVGSNADEATVFGHQVSTLEQYRTFLRYDAGKYADEELHVYPVKSDADVPGQYVRLQSDEFAYSAYSLAQAVTRAGENAYLYYFTYADAGKRAALGAHHGEELFFLSESFPESWEPQAADKKFGETVRSYWVQFAKSGNPNGSGGPPWPTYEQAPERAFELGSRIGDRGLEPRVERLKELMTKVIKQGE